jgi:hypothetical protein
MCALGGRGSVMRIVWGPVGGRGAGMRGALGWLSCAVGRDAGRGGGRASVRMRWVACAPSRRCVPMNCRTYRRFRGCGRRTRWHWVGRGDTGWL